MKKHTLHSLGILISALGAGAYSCSSPVDTGGLGGLGASGSGATGGTAAKGNTGGSSATSGSSASSSGGSIAAGGSTSGGSANSSSGGSAHLDVDASMGMTGGTTTMVDPDAACGNVTLSATLKTVNMFVMYDRSWSMTECGNTMDSMFTGGDPRCADPTQSRWALTSKALIQFVQDPSAAGLRMALRFFPDDHPVVGCDGYPTTPTGGTMMGGTMGGFFGGAGTTGTGTAGRGNTGGAGRGGVGAAGSPAGTGTGGAGDNCDATACAQPLVNIGALTADPAPTDVQEQKLVNAINNSPPPDVATLNPNPQTPTSAALQGAATWATTYEAAHPDEKTVIILITDGEPAGCDTNATDISNIAANAFMTGGIQTYVIGLGGLNSTALDQIAAAGGTMTAFTVSATMSSTTELLGELTAIQGQALKCQIDVPKADTAGKTVDPNFITVAYTSTMGGTATDLGIVSSMDKCGTDQDWYFDNPAAPTQIILCPSTCDAVTKAGMGASVSISVGCTQHVVTR